MSVFGFARPRLRRGVGLMAAGVISLAGVMSGSAIWVTSVHATNTIQNIQHVIFIMQENRSFDEYFGKYPNLPAGGGIPANACNPDPYTNVCVRPYHDVSNQDAGGGHGPNSVPTDEQVNPNNGQAMSGFISQYYTHWGMTSCPSNRLNPNSPDPTCSDSMGYKDGTDIPNYWNYAQNFVLQDNMYESVPSWSRTAHVAMVSGWSAQCQKGTTDPLSTTCKSILTTGDHYDDKPEATSDCDDFDPIPSGCGIPDYPWTDITYLLHNHSPEVTWSYYSEPDTPDMWKPLGDFKDVHDDQQAYCDGQAGCANTGHTDCCFKSVSDFQAEAASGNLPNVSWVIPGHLDSDHPSLNGESQVSDAQSYVTKLVDSVMAGPDWNSSAIFVSWDDWGGFYDHMLPLTKPQGDKNGVGFRVPAFVISPYAKQGYIDSQGLTFDSYLRFIEDDFLGGCRLARLTATSCDNRPDVRPDVRETAFGDLQSEFDFNQSPRPPMLLPTISVSNLQINAGSKVKVSGQYFQPNEQVTFNLGVAGSDCWAPGCPTSATALATTVTDSNGSFADVSLTMPANDSGRYVISALGADVATDPNDAAGISEKVLGTTNTQPPTAALTLTPSSGNVPVQVTADASASTAGSAPISSYSFNWGDGTVDGQSASATDTHTYTSGGTYTVTVTVYDTSNNTAPASKTMTVDFVGNPGFEGTGSGSLNGWKATSGTTLALNNGIAHSGTYSAKLTRTSANGRASLNDNPDWNASAVLGQVCTVSAWMQTNVGGINLNAQATESNGTSQVAQWVKSVKSVANTWQQVTVKTSNATTPSIVNNGDGLGLAFFASLQSGGAQYLLVDDVSEVCQ